ncbi:MAG: outer membrane protein assembly factor BamB family protein, partial [Acidimicrobiales bacterium]
PPVAEPYNERVVALHLDGTQFGPPAWVFTPPRLDPHSPEYNGDPNCDWDFGATANLGTLPNGTDMVGVGGKDGTYYALDPATGALRWHTNVVYGGLAGGFIGTTALDARHGRVYGATALGDFGRFEGVGSAVCQPTNPRDQLVQEPSQFSFDAADGSVKWAQPLSQTFGPTTVAGGMTFVGNGAGRHVQVRDARTGVLIKALPLQANSDSGVVVGRDALYMGTGSSEQGSADGVVAWGLPTGASGLGTLLTSLVNAVLGALPPH